MRLKYWGIVLWMHCGALAILLSHKLSSLDVSFIIYLFVGAGGGGGYIETCVGYCVDTILSMVLVLGSISTQYRYQEIHVTCQKQNDFISCPFHT